MASASTNVPPSGPPDDLALELSLPTAENLGHDFPPRRPDMLVHIQRFLLASSAALLTILIFVQVFTRYVMHMSVIGIEDLTSFVAVWLYFIGGSLGAWDRGHISASLVDLIVQSEPVRRWINAASAIVTTILAGWMTKWAFEYFLFTVERHQVSIDVRMPMFIVTVAMPLGLALMTFYFLVEAIELTRKAGGTTK